MRKGFFSALLLLSLVRIYSQQSDTNKAGSKIMGTIIDSSLNIPLEYATITLYLHGKTRPLNGTTSDSGGNFVLTNIPSGSFNVVIESVSYLPLHLTIAVNQRGLVIDLKNIYLKKRQEILQGVTVTAQAKLIDTKIDKLVFNAEKDITSQTGVATDVLKKVPQISVDVDGNVELAGSSSIRFLVNGKPSTMFGSNIADVLQSIPANQIKSIEVITNPGAKYDAQGLGGIINIILKHNTVQGINGNLSLTAGTIMQNGAININARKGKFGLNAFINGNARLATTTSSNFQRSSDDTVKNIKTFLKQDGSGNFNRHGFQTGVGFDWTFSEKNNIAGSINYGQFGNKSNGVIDQSELIQNSPGTVLSEIINVNNSNSSFRQHNIDPSFQYKRNFNREDQELEIGFSGSFGHNNRNAGNNQFLQPQDSLTYGTRTGNPAKENMYEVTVDYTQPLYKDIKFGTGTKFSGYDISSLADALVWSPYRNSYLYNSGLSNDLSYHQKVVAGYAELSFPVGKIVEARLGSRYERTQMNAFYSNSQQKIEKGYNTFIPSFFLMKKIGDNQAIKLNFTIRINRPDYADLNPFINTSDPKNITTGNPNLKPEIWYRYEASYNNDLGKTGSFIITLFYRQSNGDIQPFIAYYPAISVGDSTYNNVAVTTRKNIGIEKNAGTNLYVDLHINDKLNIRSNIIFFYRYTVNQVDIGYNSSTTIFRSTLNASYQFINNLAAEFFGSFNSHHHEAQGFYPSFISYNMAFRKQFWNKKGSIAVAANNFFSKYVDQRTELYGPGFVTTSLRKIPYRSMGINFTWKFGKLEFKKENKVENILNLGGPEQ
ncbi:MAG: TonB-dependent receptor [Bacteroidetes bacterium]|nr:TonB-dependent receptor [Bacteroidota bacterium]